MLVEVKILAFAAQSQRPLNMIEKLRHGTCTIHSLIYCDGLSQRAAAAESLTSIFSSAKINGNSDTAASECQAWPITRQMDLTTKTLWRINQSINQSINQVALLLRQLDWLIDWLIDQSINQSIHQSINRVALIAELLQLSSERYKSIWQTVATSFNIQKCHTRSNSKFCLHEVKFYVCSFEF